MTKEVKWITFLAALLLLILVGAESYQLGFASGHWIGRFSAKWVLIVFGYVLAAAAGIVFLYQALFYEERLEWAKKLVKGVKVWMGSWYWLFSLLFALLPSYLIFFSSFGALYLSIASRLLLFALSAFMLSFWLAEGEKPKKKFQSFLLAGLLIGVGLVLAESFSLVSDYPFSLHWSEGNRIWDYSVLFGRERYNFPAENDIFVFIDRGRQALWGLPFLIPNVGIVVVRFWSAFLVTIPYALLGWFAFRPLENKYGQWLLLGLWTMIFLNQGPIYTPLIFSAIMIAGLRRRSFWIAIPLALLAGHYAGISRFTWRFAPAIWVVMLTLGDAFNDGGELKLRDWLRAGALGVAAMWTKGIPVLNGIVEGIREAPSLQAALLPTATPLPPTPLPGTLLPTAVPAASIETLAGLRETLTDQALLWYRLLPNQVYAPGILIGLALAALPLILLISYVIRKGNWQNNYWSHMVNLMAGLGFLIVGITASTKIGGGADLHNLDMFLIMLVFLASMAWEAGLAKRLGAVLKESSYVRSLLVVVVFIPAMMPAFTGRPPEKMNALDAQLELERLQERVTCAAQYGEVLFMDQRQLLTFGHMGYIPLAVEYEKKYVMNQALAGNAGYFDIFAARLEAGKYSMIITERQALRYKLLEEDRLGDSLVEENNAWVKWVTIPLLEYYESISNRRSTGIEIFVPIERDFDC